MPLVQRFLSDCSDSLPWRGSFPQEGLAMNRG